MSDNSILTASKNNNIMEEKNMDNTTRIYLNTWGAYNNGCIGYGWMTTDEARDFMDEDPERDGGEWFIADIDNYTGIAFDGLEYSNVDEIIDIIETYEAWGEYEQRVFAAACEIWSVDEVMRHDIEDYTLLEDVNTDYDLGYYWLEESGCYDLSGVGFLSNYIDYEAFGRDCRLGANGDFTSCGYVELNI